jgi:hypothetical protein
MTAELVAEYIRRGWSLVPIPPGQKGPVAPGWQTREFGPGEFSLDCNVGVILGPRSGELVDVDLDCLEALALADIYLPEARAVFGRASKPRAHRLYIAPGAVYEGFADPLDGSTLLELRAAGAEAPDGRRGQHQTVFPPSLHPSGELIAWDGDTIAPAGAVAAVLRRATAWLAAGCLVMRYVSPMAARSPGPDLPAILWEWDPELARPVFGWLGLTTPDAPQRYPRRRVEQNAHDLDLAEIVHAIPNNCSWEEWNNIGLAVFSAAKDRSDGFVIFDDFSAKSGKYDRHETAARWRNYERSPPSRTGPGKLAKLAYAAGWRPS